MRTKKKQSELLALRTQRQEIAARYQGHLISYAAFANYGYSSDEEKKSLVMVATPWCLVRHVKRGIEEKYGEDIAFLLSVIVEGIMRENLEEEDRDPSDELHVRPDPELHFAQVVIWFTRHFNGVNATVPEENLLSTLHKLYDQELKAVYTAKRERRLYALVLVGDSARPVRFEGNGDGFRNLAALQEGVREHYGTAIFLPPSDFEIEVERRQVHTPEMMALLRQQSEAYDFDLCAYHVYGSASRPMSGSWARIENAVYIEVDSRETGYYTYVAVANRLDQEIVERYALTFVSGPATRADAGVYATGERSRSEYVEACRATAEQQAEWLMQHLPQMRFTLNEEYTTICTVWVLGDPDGGRVFRVGEILRTYYGAYLCGPCSNVSSLGPTFQSFGFWNWDLIDYARRIFALPQRLQPGRPVYIPSLPQECWPRVERAYNKHPSALPGYGLFAERKGQPRER